MSSVITKLSRLKKGLLQDVDDNRSEPGETLRQAGNKPESTHTSQVQYRYRPLENYLSNAAYI